MKKFFKWLGIIVVGVIVLSFVFGGNDDSAKTAAGNDQSADSTEAVEQALPISDLDFFTIRNDAEKMTDAQWAKYAEDVTGKRVHWKGYIENIEEGGKVWLDMDSPTEVISVQDVYLNVPEEDALKYNKDQAIEFEATIDRIDKILGSMSIDFEDLKIISVK